MTTHPSAGEASTVLLSAAKGGDSRAFESLAHAEERALYRHAARMLGSGPDAEDVVQDALFAAWRSIGSFEGHEGNFHAWLFRIATNRAIDVIRQRQRRGELPLDPPDDADEPGWPEPAAPGPDLAQIAGAREAVGIVEEALAGIPAAQRAALLLRDVEGFDYDEIAVITTSELGTVKSRIHRARLAVRNALVARGWSGSSG